MKKLISLALILGMLLSFSGCDDEKNHTLELPFKGSDVLYMLLSKDGGTADAVKVTDGKTIRTVYDTLTRLSVSDRDGAAEGASSVTFVFCLEDGTQYDIEYRSGGVKTGWLCSDAGDFQVFTTADVGSIWSDAADSK